jgi:transposase
MKNEKTDARKISTDAQQEKRNIAARLIKKDLPAKEIAAIVGVHVSRIYDWKAKLKKDGAKALLIGQRGRRIGDKKRLSQEQENHIKRKLIDTTPEQLKFKFALWTREAVKTLIDREFAIAMPISTVGDYLKKWQFTSKKPIKRAYERKDAATKKWLQEEYPSIKKEAKSDNADIWWCDETACQSLPNNLTGYAPIGTHNKPVLTHTAKKFKINMISAITHTGKTMFSLYDESITNESFIEFCQKAIDSNNGRKIYLIVDNLRVHHAKAVKKWEEENADKIKLFYLPAYSPDYNPDEYLNQDFKQSANRNDIPKDKEHLRRNTENYMLSLQNNPQKVANFFKHPKVEYVTKEAC